MKLLTATLMGIVTLLLASACIGERAHDDSAPTTQPQPAHAHRPVLLHLPGIGGLMRIDQNLVAGLKLGGVDAEIQIYNWVGTDRGVAALSAETRKQEQARIIADLIVQKIREDPLRPIILTGHSAGAGMAALALEKLPGDVQIDTLLMMQSALSPQYDLTSALRHVKRAFAFYSSMDTIVLSTGTRLFGTLDRVYSDAAGLVGYRMPQTADPQQYAKLTQFTYQNTWVRFRNLGDHIGPMTRPFAQAMLAPLLLTGQLPVLPPTTGPTTVPSSQPRAALNYQHAVAR
jgi:pimeloyl-ACP methyl ester carboxylesterase